MIRLRHCFLCDVFGKLEKVTARRQIIWTIKGICSPKSSTLFQFPLLLEEAEGLFWLVLGSSICFSEDDKGRYLFYNFTEKSDTSQPHPTILFAGLPFQYGPGIRDIVISLVLDIYGLFKVVFDCLWVLVDVFEVVVSCC